VSDNFTVTWNTEESERRCKLLCLYVAKLKERSGAMSFILSCVCGFFVYAINLQKQLKIAGSVGCRGEFIRLKLLIDIII